MDSGGIGGLEAVSSREANGVRDGTGGRADGSTGSAQPSAKNNVARLLPISYSKPGLK